VAFIAVKGFLSLYYKQSQYVRQANRIVKDFEEQSQPTASTISTWFRIKTNI